MTLPPHPLLQTQPRSQLLMKQKPTRRCRFNLGMSRSLYKLTRCPLLLPSPPFGNPQPYPKIWCRKWKVPRFTKINRKAWNHASLAWRFEFCKYQVRIMVIHSCTLSYIVAEMGFIFHYSMCTIINRTEHNFILSKQRNIRTEFPLHIKEKEVSDCSVCCIGFPIEPEILSYVQCSGWNELTFFFKLDGK